MRNFAIAQWAEFKSFVDARGLSIQFREDTSFYYMKAADNWFGLECNLHKATDTNEVVEFEANYKSLGNQRPVNESRSTALPNPQEFRFRGGATEWTSIPANSTADIDLTPSATEDRWVDGGFIVSSNANPGDYCVFQVVHPIAGVVEQFVDKWFVAPGTGQMKIEVYPAKITAGLILRVKYTNVGPSYCETGINFRLHRKGQ